MSGSSPPSAGSAVPATRSVAAGRRRRVGGWRQRLGHSLKARLVLMFLALALGTTALFFWGAREPFSVGWRESLRVFRSCPLITPKDARSSLQMLAIARAMAALYA